MGTYFHASPHWLEAGSVLTPGRTSNFKEGASGEHVFLSPDEGQARQWGAVIGAGKHPEMHLYEVDPHGPVTSGDSGFYDMPEHRASAARVVRHVDTFDPVDVD